MTWSEAQVLALSPDPATFNNGKALATERKWSNTGSNAESVWGECQGSGKQPYRVCIDVSDQATKCTCPSRKFPCKHAIGLFLLFTDHPRLFSASTPPQWATTWLEGRQQRRNKAEQVSDKPVNSEASAAIANRQDAREAKVRAGMDELRRWLRDLTRHGLADDRVKTYDFWDRMAARLVDAQAAGIARRLRNLAGLPFQGRVDWTARMLDEVSRLYVLAKSYAHIEALPLETQHDIRALIGWTYRQEELLALPSVRDHWRVHSEHTESEDRLRIRRVWLYGKQTQRHALLLDFAHGRTPFDDRYPLGASFDAELIYYPSALPQRALVKARYGGLAYADEDRNGFGSTIAPALNAYADALACHPWLDRFPVGLRAVVPFEADGQLYVRDEEQLRLPVVMHPEHRWTLIAASGGHPIPVFGEWNGYELALRTLFADGRYIAV